MSASTLLTHIDPARNMRRFYLMQVQPDLFGGFSLVREWGRIGQAGRVRETLCESEAEAVAALDKAQAAKLRKGYTTATPQTSKVKV